MRITIYTPKGVKTGAPKALHQQHHQVKVLGYESQLLAAWGTSYRPAIDEYAVYGPQYTNRHDLNAEDILIVPKYFRYLPRSLLSRIVRSFIPLARKTIKAFSLVESRQS